MLLIVRHGETVWNAEGRIQGQRDVPLSDVGRAQARRLAARLALSWRHGWLPGPPVAAWASDLGRAGETAQILIEATQSDLWLRTDPLLRERAFGSWEGSTANERRARMADQEISPTAEPPDGETWPAVCARMDRALDCLWREHASPAAPIVLVVGHGSALRVLLARALGADPVTAGPRFRLENTSLCIATFAGTKGEIKEGRLVLVNDAAHLLPLFDPALAA